MATTFIGPSSSVIAAGAGPPTHQSLAVRKQSVALATEAEAESYWGKRFVGEPGSSMPVILLKDLEKAAGDLVTFDLSVHLKSDMIEGDNVLEGNEAKLEFYSDEVRIDQCRTGIDLGGRMTRKRTVHDLRDTGRKALTRRWARWFDANPFVYASGARGTNPNIGLPLPYAGFAGNPIVPPDQFHHIVQGDKNYASLVQTDVMTLDLIDKIKAIADDMGSGSIGIPMMNPISIAGEDRFVFVMSPFQAFSMRQFGGGAGWLDIQKAVSPAFGEKSPIFTGSLGMYNGVVLHQHKHVVRFNDYGLADPTGATPATGVEAHRALLLGEQALVMVFGSPGGDGLRFDWYETSRDAGNRVIIDTGTICGVKKCTFNGIDMAVIAVDTAAQKP